MRCLPRRAFSLAQFYHISPDRLRAPWSLRGLASQKLQRGPGRRLIVHVDLQAPGRIQSHVCARSVSGFVQPVWPRPFIAGASCATPRAADHRIVTRVGRGALSTVQTAVIGRRRRRWRPGRFGPFPPAILSEHLQLGIAGVWGLDVATLPSAAVWLFGGAGLTCSRRLASKGTPVGKGGPASSLRLRPVLEGCHRPPVSGAMWLYPLPWLWLGPGVVPWGRALGWSPWGRALGWSPWGRRAGRPGDCACRRCGLSPRVRGILRRG